MASLITVLIPVLGRPQNAAKVVESIDQNSDTDPEILFVISPDDEAEKEAVIATGADFWTVPWSPGPADFAKKTNVGFAVTNNEWIFAGADDLFFEEGWDTRALEIADATDACVIGTNDLANPAVMRGEHATHSLVRRSYVDDPGATWLDGPGYVYSEAYDHQHVDNELVAAARWRDVWAFATESHVRHLHPIFNKDVAMDDTYRKALARGSEDARTFQNRRREALRRMPNGRP